MTKNRVMAVDPIGCGCTNCIVGRSRPVDELNLKQVIKLHFGKLDNRTSGFIVDINVTLIDMMTMPDGKVCGTVAAATLISGYPGGAKQTWDVTAIMQRGDLCCDCVGDCDCDYDD